MNERTDRQSPEMEMNLQDLIDEYVFAVGRPSYRTLVAWIERYPQYRDELTDFTVAWSLMENVPLDAKVLQSINAEDTVKRHMEVAQKVLGGPESAPLKGLVAEGRARGLSTSQLARASGLSVPLVTKLDRRLIRFATIPGEVVAAVAQVLGREANAVAAYLQGGPLLAPSASYRAEEAPSLPEQQDFAEAVRTDRTLDEEARQRLLGNPPPGNVEL